ncbi:MAG: pyridoxamine 5'-phosphate oxidase family protein [Nitrospirota bacterium]
MAREPELTREKLEALFREGGTGVMTSASAEGRVNAAIYARPHVTEEGTLAWGMTEGRTLRNVKENPSALFLYMNPGVGYAGVRVALRRERLETAGPLLDEIRQRTEELVGPEVARRVVYVAYFSVTEVRPLV